MIASLEHQRYSQFFSFLNQLDKIHFYLSTEQVNRQAKNLEYSDFFGNFISKKWQHFKYVIQIGQSTMELEAHRFADLQRFLEAGLTLDIIHRLLKVLSCLFIQLYHQISNFGILIIGEVKKKKLEVIVDNRLVAHFDQIAKIIIIGYDNYLGISEFQVWTNSQGCSVQGKDSFDGCFQGRYECVQGCKDCIRGMCIECQSGWEYHVLSQTCQHICGDQMIISIEECDDGNEFNCQYSCPLFCQQGEFGKCLKCQSNYNLIDQRCEEINESQDSKSKDNFSMINQISNFLDQGNYGQDKK